MSVEAAVQRDLEPMPEPVRESGLAATALALARELDDPSNSATSKSMCAGKLIDALSELRALAPEKVERTKLDEITAKREERLARRTGS